jgi:hypothetical protein
LEPVVLVFLRPTDQTVPTLLFQPLHQMVAVEVDHQRQDKLMQAALADLAVAELDSVVLVLLATHRPQIQVKVITGAAVILMGLSMALAVAAAQAGLEAVDLVTLPALAAMEALHQLAGVLSLMLLALAVGFMHPPQSMAQTD